MGVEGCSVSQCGENGNELLSGLCPANIMERESYRKVESMCKGVTVRMAMALKR